MSLFQQLTSQQTQGNPLLQTNINTVKNIMNLAKTNGNPTQILSQMAQSNPQIKQALNLAHTSGKSLKDIFYEMAQQKGVDPNTILNQLKM